MLAPLYMQAVPAAAEGPTDVDGAGTLTLLHNNDGESAVLTIPYSTEAGQLPVGSVAAFKTLMDGQINEAHTAGNAVVSVYAGDAFLASSTLACSLPPNNSAPVYDAVAQRQMAYDAHILGNHEFDYSPDFLKRFIEGFNDGSGLTQPFLSANLDFSGESSFDSLVDADGVLHDPVTDGRVIAHSLVMTDSNQRFGIVGATTPQLPTISSPRNVTVTINLTETATAVQAEIDKLYNEHGVRKIIFVSHLQSVSNDKEIIPMLKHVDIAVAGGGDDLLINTSVPTDTQLLPGEDPEDIAGEYPTQLTDADGRTVYLVTGVGNYKYLGQLDVAFDGNGEVASFNTETSYPRRVIPTSDVATTLGLTDTVAMDAGIISSVNEPIEQCLQDLETTPIARTEVLLDVSRTAVRGTESNAGNMIADSFLYMYGRYSNTNGLRAGTEPVIAVQNGGGIRQNAGNELPTTGIVPGTISRRNTLDVLPFNNLLSVIQTVTPTDMKGILERSAERLPDAGGQFLQISGFKVTYNRSNSPGSRVISAELNDGTKIIDNGATVDGAPSVTIVTNNFIARGGDNYPQFGNNPNQMTLRDTSGTFIFYEQAWREYLQSFPVSGDPALPTISASDTRYQPGGEGRITIEGDPTAVSLAELSTNSTTVPVWPFALGLLAGSLGLLALRRQTR